MRIDNEYIVALGPPEEVAAVAVLLASDEAPYISGVELNMDGGIPAGSTASPDAGGASALVAARRPRRAAA